MTSKSVNHAHIFGDNLHPHTMLQASLDLGELESSEQVAFQVVATVANLNSYK